MAANAAPQGIFQVDLNGKTVTHLTDAAWRSIDNPGANWHNRAIDASAWPA